MVSLACCCCCCCCCAVAAAGLMNGSCEKESTLRTSCGVAMDGETPSLLCYVREPGEFFAPS
uniref:Secreted protein n=1 Tax=Triticum urartu TaxID=4572 RepID=A0A8R7UZ95_TRIUA